MVAVAHSADGIAKSLLGAFVAAVGGGAWAELKTKLAPETRETFAKVEALTILEIAGVAAQDRHAVVGGQGAAVVAHAVEAAASIAANDAAAGGASFGAVG